MGRIAPTNRVWVDRRQHHWDVLADGIVIGTIHDDHPPQGYVAFDIDPTTTLHGIGFAPIVAARALVDTLAATDDDPATLHVLVSDDGTVKAGPFTSAAAAQRRQDNGLRVVPLSQAAA